MKSKKNKRKTRDNLSNLKNVKYHSENLFWLFSYSIPKPLFSQRWRARVYVLLYSLSLPRRLTVPSCNVGAWNWSHDSSSITLLLIHWGSVSQSNPELIDMVSCASKFDQKIPCPFPVWNYNWAFRSSWHFTWVLRIKTRVSSVVLKPVQQTLQASELSSHPWRYVFSAFIHPILYNLKLMTSFNLKTNL